MAVLRPGVGLMKLVVTQLVLVAMTTSTIAAGPALLELDVLDHTYRGKQLAHNQQICWLMGEDGELHRVTLDRVTAFRRADRSFRPTGQAEMRDRLQRELGRGFEVVGTSHYIVCAAPGRARHFAAIFEDVYRKCHSYFTVRRLPVATPEFPMVAIVFPDRDRFAAYAQQDKVRAVRGLMGYYLRTSNRIALFEDGGNQRSALPLENPQSDRLALRSSPIPGVPSVLTEQPAAGEKFRAAGNQGWSGSIAADLEDTMVHEATHQFAFNVGLHSRIGETPQWVVEGLATVFEAPGIREGGGRGNVAERINRERYLWYGNYAKRRRSKNGLVSFLQSDIAFRSATLDAYSQAWALTFFLIETRPTQYADYLRRVAVRDPLDNYTATQRLDDFRAAFGRNVEWLDVEMTRFIDRLNPGDVSARR